MRRRGAAALAAAAAAALVGGCAPAAEPERLVLATGPAGAVYREIGADFAELADASSHPIDVDVLHTAAAVENAELLRAGRADIGFVNVDVLEAERGGVTALARVFDSVLHVVVPEESDIERLADLDGRTVSGGLERSGTRFMTETLLDGVGADVELVSMSQADAADALRDGRIEAMISLAALPTPAIERLAAERPIRLLDLQDVAALPADGPAAAYSAVAVPAATYRGVGSVVALGVPTLLAARPGLGDDAATAVVDVLFDDASELASTRPEARQINPRTGAATTPVPMHPAAVRWFRDQKP